MTDAEQYKERIWGSMKDYNAGRKELPSFCTRCGAYMRPEQTGLCDECREPTLWGGVGGCDKKG